MARGGTDPRERAHLLHEVFDAVLSGETGPTPPRSVVSASWQRSLAARVDPDRRTPPVVVRDAELPDLRSAHPLNEVMPLLRSTLVSIADEAMHVMLVTDAEGIILWRDGAAKLLHAADGAGLAPGTWSAPTTPGPAWRRRCTIPTPAPCSAPSTSAGRWAACIRR